MALGVDPAHFGVIVVVNTMIGLATPPYGLLLFVLTSITRAPIRETIRRLPPFLAIMIAGLGIITFCLTLCCGRLGSTATRVNAMELS